MVTGLNHITLSVRDLTRSFDFYSKILGLKPLMRHFNGAYFLAGDLWFCLELDPKAFPDAPSGYNHFAFSVEQQDFKNLSQKIANSGAKIWKDNKSEDDSLYFLDPDGHQLEIHFGGWKSRLDHYKKNSKYSNMTFFPE